MQKPILSFGRYKLLYRSNDDYAHFEKTQQNTPLLFSLLRLFASIKVGFAYIFLLGELANTLHIPSVVSYVGGTVGLLLIVFVSRAFFATFELIDTKFPAQTSKGIGTLDWGWVLVLVGLGIAQRYINETLVPAYVIAILLVVIGTPYLLYQLRTLLK